MKSENNIEATREQSKFEYLNGIKRITKKIVYLRAYII
jgi:hypothetical protein